MVEAFLLVRHYPDWFLVFFTAVLEVLEHLHMSILYMCRPHSGGTWGLLHDLGRIFSKLGVQIRTFGPALSQDEWVIPPESLANRRCKLSSGMNSIMNYRSGEKDIVQQPCFGRIGAAKANAFVVWLSSQIELRSECKIGSSSLWQF